METVLICFTVEKKDPKRIWRIPVGRKNKRILRITGDRKLGKKMFGKELINFMNLIYNN